MSTVPTEAQEVQMHEAVPDTAPPRRRKRWRRIVVLVILAAVVGGGVVVVNNLWNRNRAKSSVSEATAQTATTTVQKTKLVSQTRLNGTLGYIGAIEVVNRANGTLTKVPKAGELAKHGTALYEVDGKPVIYLRGTVPAYRELTRNIKGPDVAQLNAELVALGYVGAKDLDPKSTTFGWPTYFGLKKMQKQFGLTQSGTLELGTAVFLSPEQVRITEVTASAGAPVPAGTLMKASSTDRQVTVALEASRVSGIKVGDEVTVTLPDRKTTPGSVSSIDTVAKQSESGSPTVDVFIKLAKPEDAGPLDQAPVQVSVVSGSVNDVLAVPVNALLALAGGGYAVEAVESDGTRKLYPVELGLFDDSAGLVQITGAEVAADQTIVVPAA